MTLLTEIKPSKLNAVLGGLANSFQDNGDAIGSTITQANAYLKKFNPLLVPLQRDWRSAGGFSDVYAGAGNSIADTIRNAGTIADTVADEHDNLRKTAKAASKVTLEIYDFFGDNAEDLTKTVRGFRPFTSLIDEYAPEITCFIDGEAVLWDRMSAAFNESGPEFEANMVQPGTTELYRYPRDLPTVGPGAEKGPNCRGLPVVSHAEDSLADYTTGPESFNQRTTDNSPRLNPGSPAQQFFGMGPGVAPYTFPALKKAGK
jgi:phospholipid/cholesterol/gamma-HCH transport system substrate-binding protein